MVGSRHDIFKVHSHCSIYQFPIPFLILWSSMHSWVFIGRTDAEAETPVLWPPDGKSWLIGKDPDAGRDLGQEEKGTTEDEMAWWHHWLDGRESEWTPGVSDGQGGLACCDSSGHKESDMTEQLDWNELNHEKNIRQAPTDWYSRKYLTNTPQNCCSHQTQGNDEKLEQTRFYRDMT